MKTMRASLQWKGTSACCDITCTCGRYYHFDGEFMSQVKCGCGLVWTMSPDIATSITPDNEVFRPIDLEAVAVHD